jgi:acetolactate synthase-1/2/3 large subunit
VTPAHASSAAGPDRPPAPGERLDVFSLAAAIGATLPAGAIVVDEGQTSSLGLWDALAAVPHDLLALTGGAIGGGPPLAVGAALAAPGRRVVNLEGDGSALYSLGAWWTQASRQLDVTTVIAGNGGYTILDLELGRSDLGHLTGGPLTSLRSADLDFVALAAGYGVPGVRVADGPALVAALRDSFASPGPRVIHAVL